MLRLFYWLRFFTIATIVVLVLLPATVESCESCRVGNPESPLTAGMNVAIFTLLGVTTSVLGCFGLFFLRLKKRAQGPRNN